MRVPNISLYSVSKNQLNTITNNLRDANEVVSTQKQINNISDDPIGLSQVLDLRLSVKNLTQLDKNVDLGKTWLDGTEAALKSVQQQLIDAKLLATQLVNASMSTSERADAVETIEGIIDQVMSLSNAQVNGSYVFSGTMNNVRTYTYDDDANPTKAVYHGNYESFAIKTGTVNKLDVGRIGKEVFTETEIIVDGTNNKIVFKEDPGLGLNSQRVLEGTIPDGTYTPEELAVIVRNTMNAVSKESGYEINYEVTYDASSKKFSIADDGRYDGYFGFDLMWESGETPRIGGINTQGILKDGVDIKVLQDTALIHDTPVPSGTAPIRLTWDGEGKWKVLNDPGYGLPLEIDGTDRYVKLDLNGNGIADITVSTDSIATSGDFIEFDIIAESDDHSIGPDLGFTFGDVSYKSARSNSEVTLKTFDHTNNVIDFQENIGAGLSSQLSAAIPPGEYKDMDVLAAAIEKAMEDASVNSIDYSVAYSDQTNRFTIGENTSTTSLTDLQMLWTSGSNVTIGAGADLGFTADDSGTTSYSADSAVTLFSIDATNNKINFKEILPDGTQGQSSELTATIPTGNYTDIDTFTRAVEDALEDASEANGNRVDYEVSYSYISHKFTIKEDGELGRKLKDLELLWGTGTDMATSAGTTLGFDTQDTSSPPSQSQEVTWGIFETLFSLKEYLAKDDEDGISRSMTRLDTHYNSITSVLSDIGIKSNRLAVRKQVTAETKLTITERKSMIEDADIVESVMDLKAIQTAYEASLSSTSKIINLSLVDFL